MKNHRHGFTLTEIMVYTAVFGLASLAIVKATKTLSDSGNSIMDNQTLQLDTASAFAFMSVKIKNAGDGLLNNPQGVSIIAIPDSLVVNNQINLNLSTDFLFLSKDNDPKGNLEVNDEWIRFSTASHNGRYAIREQRYHTDNWDKIKNGTVQPFATKYVDMQSGVDISGLYFTMFDSQSNVANQSPKSSSSVRIVLELKKRHKVSKKAVSVMLEGILHGPKS